METPNIHKGPRKYSSTLLIYSPLKMKRYIQKINQGQSDTAQQRNDKLLENFSPGHADPSITALTANHP